MPKEYTKTLELSGGTVTVEAWSFDTFTHHVGTVVTMISEALTETDDDAPLLSVLTPLFAKSKPLILASLVNEDDIDKARGLHDILDLTQAVIEINGLDEVLMGKLTTMLNKLAKSVTPSQAPTSSAQSSKKRAKATAN